MSKGKYSKNQGFNARPLVLMLAVALLIGATIGGTIAWLTAKTENVVNTFTVGDIALTLKETEIKWTKDDNGKETGAYTYGEEPVVLTQPNQYKLIPGEKYTKDPVIEVSAESEDCYLFVKLAEVNDPGSYLSYGYNVEGWTELEKSSEEVNGNLIKTTVLYRIVKKTDKIKTFELLKDNKITVNNTVVKTGTNRAGYVDMPAADKAPNLIFTAYAVQTANLTVDQAWAEVSK